MQATDLILNGEVILSGYVLLDEYAPYMWPEDLWFSPRMVREALIEIGDGPVTVRLNSNGGHAEAGEQIRAVLDGHPGGCTIVVEGMAASAASLLFMAGRPRGMSAGSLLMIHDPSGAAWGTEEEMRRQADVMNVVANTYAGVYATASGKTTAEARRIMQAETYYSAEAAVAEGFADQIISNSAAASPALMCAPAPISMDMARQAVAEAQRVFVTRMQRVSQPAKTATTQESAMLNTNPAVPTATPTPAPVATASPVMVQQSAPIAAQQPDPVMQERTRARDIRAMAAPFMTSGRLVEADVTALIDDGTSVADAGARLMARMAAAEPTPGAQGSGVRIVRDETDTRLEGMIGALMQDFSGPGAAYRGMKLKRLAVELAGPQRGFDDMSAIRRGMVGTTMMGGAFGVSDFAYITTEVMNRSLIAAYNRRAATWQAVCGAPLTASDFRELHAVRFGGDFSLKKVLENGEYQSATLSDEAEGLKVERRGRTITLTFEAVVNDDMGAFARIPTEFAMAARTMESSMVWNLIRANAVLKSDSKALFHVDHGNLAGAAAAITVTSVGLGRKAMWEQRGSGTVDTDDFIQVEPNRLIVPPALEVVALQFATGITPTKSSDANPYRGTLEPITVPNLGAAAGGSDTAWYLVSSDLPPIQHAYLDGYSTPTVQTIEGMNPDAVKMNARHIFGAAAVEFRGAFKNAGA